MTKLCFWAGWVAGGFGVLGCQGPTQVMVDIYTDVSCTEMDGVRVVVGEPGHLEEKDPAARGEKCTKGDGPLGNKLGRVVIVPSGDDDSAEFAVKVVGGVYRKVDSCTASDGYEGCIVARRALRFIPHSTLQLPIVLRSSCEGIGCTPTTTCVLGVCRDATIDDPNVCEVEGACGEDVLGGGGAGGAGSGGGGMGGGGGGPVLADEMPLLPSTGCGKPSVLNSTFETIDTTLWKVNEAGGLVTLSSAGELVMELPASLGNSSVWLESLAAVDLTEDMLVVDVLSVPEMSSLAEVRMMAVHDVDASHWAAIEVVNGTLGLHVAEGANDVEHLGPVFDAGMHRFLRLRHGTGMMHLEASSDRVDWSEIAAPIGIQSDTFLRSVKLRLALETNVMLNTPVMARFGSINRLVEPAGFCKARDFADDIMNPERGLFWDKNIDPNPNNDCTLDRTDGVGIETYTPGMQSFYCGYLTRNWYDLEVSSAMVHVPALYNSNTPLRVFLAVEDRNARRFEMGYRAVAVNSGKFYVLSPGGQESIDNYSGALEYWRIRSEMGNLVFEVSADGSTGWKEIVNPELGAAFDARGVSVELGIRGDSAVNKGIGVTFPAYNVP